MKKFASVAASAAVLASAACAEEMTYAEGAATASETAESTAAAEADLTGQAVFDSSGAQIGTVERVVADANGIESAIVSVGAYLGVGSRSVAIPKSELTAKSDGTGLTLSMTNEEIEALPAHEDAPSYTPPDAE